jgi:P2-related tail formation protein
VGAPEAAYELLKYRDNLKALRGVMETLQFSLLAEKARLENVRANLQSACAWATSVREISLEP